MASQGPARLIIQRCLKRIVLHAGLLAMVTGVVALEVTPAKADTGMSKNEERHLKAPAPKRKVGASSGFGVRRDPINKRRDFHKGIDISRPAGTKVFAWSDGVVDKAGWMGDYGYAVDVLHSNGVKTRYAHLRAVHVREGQKLLAGQTLGQVGRTGRATGANLHFEIMVDGKVDDPRKHLLNVVRIVSS
jgi:murein DD-endopeptidase MepM/ murein hydrolase activator NlpD